MTAKANNVNPTNNLHIAVILIGSVAVSPVRVSISIQDLLVAVYVTSHCVVEIDIHVKTSEHRYD